MAGGPNDIAMDNRFSFKMYPRKDTVYTHKKSLNYDLMRSKIMRYRDAKKTQKQVVCTWWVYGIVGIITGLTASMMVWCEDKLTFVKRDLTS